MDSIPSLAKLYQNRRFENELLRSENIANVYRQCPELKRIDKQIQALTLKKGLQRRKQENTTDYPQTEYPQITSEINELSKQRIQLLNAFHIEDGYLDELYTCSLCKDNGFINGEYCRCYLQWKADLLFFHSPIKKQLEKENFSTFDFSLFDDIPIGNSPVSPRENIRIAYDSAKKFVNEFKDCDNLLFQGTTGVGKTFLTNCIAKELLSQGYTVCYLSASTFFQIMSKHSFSNGNDNNTKEQYDFIQNCDLLIIDDLGTEVHSSFVDSALFETINQAGKLDKRMIISTNLTMKQMNDTYSKRTVSRIIEQYHIIPIFGKDLRLKNT